LDLEIREAASRLEREQAFDLRRQLLCGELHLHRDLVDDGLDSDPSVWLGVAWSGPSRSAPYASAGTGKPAS